MNHIAWVVLKENVDALEHMSDAVTLLWKALLISHENAHWVSIMGQIVPSNTANLTSLKIVSVTN